MPPYKALSQPVHGTLFPVFQGWLSSLTCATLKNMNGYSISFFVQNTEFSQLTPLPLLEKVLLGGKACLRHVVVTLLSFLPDTRIFHVAC
jgi:hypothetical protein